MLRRRPLTAALAALALVASLVLPLAGTAGAAGAAGAGTPTSPAAVPPPTTDPTPTTSPSSDPSPAGTDPASTPDPEPTEEPGGSGSGGGGSGDSGGTADRPQRYLTADQAARIRAELEESNQAVVDAQLALAEADAELFALSALLEEAEDELTRAIAVDAKAQADLEAAQQAEARADRDLDDVEERMGSSREVLGQVARTVYQSGAYSSMSVALDAQTPSEFADRLIGVDTVVRAENAALARLSVARADLLNSQERYRTVREQLAERRAEAAQTVRDKRAAQAEAEAAKVQLDDVRGRRSAAVTAAEAAREADIAEHAAFLAYSGELGRSILASIAARLASTGGAGAAVATGSWVRPGTGEVTSAFGPRFHPILRYTKTHTGTDLSVGDGWVYAADAGVVVEARSDRAYGGMTVIDHGVQGGQSVTTLYGHQATMLVAPGEAVSKGQRIGRIGSTGYSTGPHLHFEIRLDGVPVDPGQVVATAPLPA